MNPFSNEKQNSQEDATPQADKPVHTWRDDPEILNLIKDNPELSDMLDTPDFEVILAKFIQNLLDQNEL